MNEGVTAGAMFMGPIRINIQNQNQHTESESARVGQRGKRKAEATQEAGEGKELQKTHRKVPKTAGC